MSNSHKTNPWLGLTSYEFEDSFRFFGRSIESGQLSEAITNNAVTVIYGPSGSGKTSIIKAGVFPKLIQEYYLPVYIRLQHNSDINYSGQILKSIEATALSQGIDIEQICDFNYTVNAEDALWVYLHTRIFWRKDNYPVVPLLVIDQFEEIFTLNQNTKKISDFFRSVDELYDHLPPPDVKNIVESTENYIPFLNDAKYKLVLSLREDFLARLEDYSRDIPILRKNRFGLKSMNGPQAFEVITNPIPNLVSDLVALKIIRKISGQVRDITKDDLSETSVETSILSLFCSELYKRMEENSLDKITESLVDASGDNIIEDYYTNTMMFVSKHTTHYIEDNLLTKSGFRNTIALEDALENDVKKHDIEELQNKRLIKIEIVNGTERIEFTHDILCRVAKDKRDIRKNKKERKIETKIGRRYIFNGVFCYSFFIIAFWSLWETNSGIQKLVLLFPISILLSHFMRVLIIANEKKAVLFRFVAVVFNIVTLSVVPDDFADNFHIKDRFYGEFDDIYQLLFLIFLIITPAINAIKNLFKINKFNNRMTWKDIYTLQCYKRYPYLVRIDRDILLPVAILMSACIAVFYSKSLIFILICLVLIYAMAQLKKWKEKLEPTKSQ